MSTLTHEALSAYGPEAGKLPEQFGNVSIEACTRVQLSENITFSSIFAGVVQISEDTLVYDRAGERVDTLELLSQIDSRKQGE